ncbi:hypothetical protein K450DRAFT_218169 [Umbelopsis ramanniana AG]|uniref:Uncharacterized protein n=1 Tax=Umbelopsis ramanniana AG TaxID=1314678 RepID=A0AAD5EJ96_UMBRA|nr:uncharacterized protein K450DRAFT_218169 [Umbelopsis ramanniana AG]KAI8584105.1 hypothetical protein K450DRAFT_218169 [Umbelopsis ramanniana AG]
MHAARQEAAIYHSHDSRRSTLNPPRHTNTTPTVIRIDKVPSALQKSYSVLSHKEPIKLKPPSILKPPPPMNISQRNVLPAGLSKKAMKDPSAKSYVPSHSASKVESLKGWPMDKPLEKDGMEEVNAKQKNAKAAKDSAIVNFGIFKELSGH